VALVPLGFLTLFFAWPVVAIVGLGLRGSVLDTLVSAETWKLVGFTAGQAAASTVVALLAGMPLAFLVARTKLPGTRLVRAVILVPFVLPTVVVGLAFRSLMPDGGVLSIVIANSFFNVAVFARTVGGMWANVDHRAEDAARALGATKLRAFAGVTLPVLAPAIGSAAAVVFLFCSTSFGVVLILGASRFRTLETEIYLRTVQLFDLPGAAALSLLQLAAVIAALVVGAVARRKREAAVRRRAVQPRRPVGGEWVVVGLAYGVVALLLTPIVSLVSQASWSGFRALSGTGHDNSLDVSGWDAALNSLRTATDATVLALVLGVLASVALTRLRRAAELMDVALMLPLGVSAVTVGFGYLVTLDALPGDLRTSPLLVPLAQAIVVTPLIIRVLVPVLRSIDDRLRQAASTLGASPWRVWREVDVPMAGKALVTAAAFGYVVALGEFGATSFLARPDRPTLPVAIGRLISRPGELNNQMAYAACTLLMVVTVAVVVLIERFQTSVGEF
jgi:thiamine transport system permease protein